MSDRYSQLVNAPVVSTVAKQLGLPQPVELERYRARRPGHLRPACSPAPRPAGGSASELAAFLDQIKAERAGSRGPGQGAPLRRHRDRRLDRAGRAAALLLPRRRPPAAQRPGDRARHAAGRGRLGPRPHRPASAGGLHPLARQGGRRPGRDSAAGPRRTGRRGSARLDPALPALAALGLRLRPGGADRAGVAPTPKLDWERPLEWQGRRWSPAPRAGSAPRSPRPSPATAPTSSGSTCRRRPPS